MSQSLSRLQLLRTQIEANVPTPAIIMVTSAKASDGCTTAATMLAYCLAGAGHRVALLSSDMGTLVLKDVGPSVSRLPFSTLECASRTKNFVEQGCLRLRQDFDYTVVDGPPLMENDVSTRLARTADAVLLSIRLGRAACVEDQSMMENLQLAKARVLGVIGTSDVSALQRKEALRSNVLGEEKAAHPPVGSKTTAPIISA